MTRTRKMLLLASMALVALAFAVPASASAYTSWTYGGKVVKNGGIYKQSYEGTMGWQDQLQGYHCTTTVEIEVTGPTAGRISRVERKPETCWGYGWYYGYMLTGQSDNISNGWNIDIAAPAGSPLKVTTPGTYLKMTEEFNEYPPSTKHWEFPELNLDPTLNEKGIITSFLLQGIDASGYWNYQGGPFTPTTTPQLGLK